MFRTLGGPSRSRAPGVTLGGGSRSASAFPVVRSALDECASSSRRARPATDQVGLGSTRTRPRMHDVDQKSDMGISSQIWECLARACFSYAPELGTPDFRRSRRVARRSRANRKKALEICQLIREADFPRDRARHRPRPARANARPARRSSDWSRTSWRWWSGARGTGLCGTRCVIHRARACSRDSRGRRVSASPPSRSKPRRVRRRLEETRDDEAPPSDRRREARVLSSRRPAREDPDATTRENPDGTSRGSRPRRSPRPAVRRDETSRATDGGERRIEGSAFFSFSASPFSVGALGNARSPLFSRYLPPRADRRHRRGFEFRQGFLPDHPRDSAAEETRARRAHPRRHRRTVGRGEDGFLPEDPGFHARPVRVVHGHVQRRGDVAGRELRRSAADGL